MEGDPDPFNIIPKDRDLLPDIAIGASVSIPSQQLIQESVSKALRDVNPKPGASSKFVYSTQRRAYSSCLISEYLHGEKERRRNLSKTLRYIAGEYLERDSFSLRENQNSMNPNEIMSLLPDLYKEVKKKVWGLTN